MIQAPPPLGPLYAAALVQDGPAGARLRRELQSAAAQAMLERLQAARPGLQGSSKSHARAAAAAAIGTGRVGVDLEYHDPRREIGRIAAFLTDAQARDEAAAYRAVTFYEAYFKAVGDFPERALLRAAMAAAAARFELDGLSCFYEQPLAGFSLCLVWDGGGEAERLFSADAR